MSFNGTQVTQGNQEIIHEHKKFHKEIEIVKKKTTNFGTEEYNE